MDVTAATALSGLQAAQARMDATANNVANAQTPGFRRQQVSTVTVPSGGVTTSVTRADTPGEDLNADAVELISAKHAFLANVQVFRTQDRMLGTLLDEAG